VTTLPRPIRRQHVDWATLLILSVVMVAVLELAHVSAALLLGPMLAAVVVATSDSSAVVPPPIFMFGQSIVGCMIAASMPLSIGREILQDWPTFVVTVTSVLIVSVAIGWGLARFQVLPGTVAVWGSLPGAASAMALMAETFGADVRVVALMQYTRVLLTAIVASVVAKCWGVDVSPQSHSQVFHTWFPNIAWPAFVATMLLACSAAWLGRRLRVPAGPLLVPMFVGVVLQDAGWLDIQLPRWLLALAYATVGWGIGLRFNRAIVRHVAKALPRVLLSTIMLIGTCGLLAVLLARFAHVDPLTAYLATSPGGADSVAIIANATPVNAPFVMALQTARFLVVILTGPTLAKLVARRVAIAAPNVG